MSWHLLHQFGRKRAYEFIGGGEKMPAAWRLELGLVNRIEPTVRMLQDAIEWATQLASKPPLALRYSKEALAAAILIRRCGSRAGDWPTSLPLRRPRI